MYTEFYNLKEKPFTLSPSSRFLYLGEVHKEALALLTYGVAERKGFTLLTGEVGTGKTTMIHALLANLGKNIQYVHLSNPLLSTKDFLNYLASSVFDNKVVFRSKTAFLVEFENFLKRCLQHQQNFILIIDEAHKLSFELLEEIRLLSNMETADEKLINIFLAGQPELNEKLSQPQSRALLQRINTRYHILPLDRQSTHEYILKRLEMAGAKNKHKILTKNVIDAIYKYSEGYPRMINILADNVLLLGYARGTRKIQPTMVRECYEDLRLEVALPKTISPELQGQEVKNQRVHRRNWGWKWAAMLILPAAISASAIIWHGELKFVVSEDTIVEERKLAKENISKEIEILVEAHSEDPIQGQTSSNENTNKNPIGQAAITSVETDMIEHPEHEEDGNPQETVVMVKEGETLMALAINAYGQADEGIMNLIQEYNPEIRDKNRIAVGQEIVLPQLSTSDSEQGSTFTVHIASCKPFENARKLFLNLLEQGHEAYIIPVNSTQKGKFFRISLGNFKSPQEAETYADELLENSISDYARVIQLEMK